MKKTIIGVGCALGLSLGFTAPASADVTTQHVTEISIEINTCTGEDVLIEGKALQVIRNFGDDGQAVRLIVTAKGTGLTTGNPYTINWQSYSENSENDTVFESTFRRRIVSQGPEPDEWVVARLSTDPTDEDFITTFCRP